jgi:hypothetical protein
MIGLSWLDEVQDARVEYTNLEGFFSVGGLIGQSDSNLSKVSADTSIRVLNYVWSSNKSRYGGLIGTLSGGQIFNCYSDGTVYADDHFTIKSVGGLIGAIQGSGGAVIEHCHSNAAVKGKHSFGGFVGTIYKSVNISQSYATGKIGGDYNPTGNFAGGFVGAISLSGSNQQVEINTSYATGDVIGVSGGGFIGTVFETGLNSQAIIQDTYSTGDVYAISAGGFLGYSAGSYHIQNSYSAGSVGQYIPYPGIVAFPWFAGFTLDFDSAIHTLENVVTISDVNEVLQFPDALYGVVVAESNSAQPNNFLAYYTEENLCPLNCNLLGTAVGSKSDFYINKLSLPPYNWSFGATQWQANFNSLPTIPSAGAF